MFSMRPSIRRTGAASDRFARPRQPCKPSSWHTPDMMSAVSVPLAPDDEFNRRLAANVHPPAWENPAPDGRYNLVVIGAGTAGLVTAAVAAGLGAKVALVERHLMGGDCLNVGCVPSKGLIRAAPTSTARCSTARTPGSRASTFARGPTGFSVPRSSPPTPAT